MMAHDLVIDSELETVVQDDRVQHRFQERGTSGKERKVVVVETWIRKRRLGSGSFGTVWLEHCDAPATPGGPQVRAVKEIRIADESNVDYNRELLAIAKFSHAKVSEDLRASCDRTFLTALPVCTMFCAVIRLVPDSTSSLYCHGVSSPRGPQQASHPATPRR